MSFLTSCCGGRKTSIATPSRQAPADPSTAPPGPADNIYLPPLDNNRADPSTGRASSRTRTVIPAWLAVARNAADSNPSSSALQAASTPRPTSISAYPALAASQSRHVTAFESAGALEAASDPMNAMFSQIGVNSGLGGHEFAPRFFSPPAEDLSAEFIGDRAFEACNYRTGNVAPVSIGTSQPDRPLLTGGVENCIVVGMAGFSPDGTRAHGQLFHVHEQNRFNETFTQYKDWLIANGHNRFSVVTMGGVAGQHAEGLIRSYGDSDNARRIINQCAASIRQVKSTMAAIELTADEGHDQAGERRPVHVTSNSLMGFELRHTADSDQLHIHPFFNATLTPPSSAMDD